jgi:hypothetical protein
MRMSEPPSVTIVITSAVMRSSRADAIGALSRIDHDTSVADPGSSAASTTVRPLALERLVIHPADSRTSAWSPGRSILARAAPAGGTGRTNSARPGRSASGAAHSRSTENGPGP